MSRAVTVTIGEVYSFARCAHVSCVPGYLEFSLPFGRSCEAFAFSVRSLESLSQMFHSGAPSSGVSPFSVYSSANANGYSSLLLVVRFVAFSQLCRRGCVHDVSRFAGALGSLPPIIGVPRYESSASFIPHAFNSCVVFPVPVLRYAYFGGGGSFGLV